VRAVPAERGILTWKHIEPVIYARERFARPPGSLKLRTRQPAGGSCTPLPVLEEIWNGAKERKLPVHLDGARIFNASTALGGCEDADARIRYGHVLPVEGIGRAGGFDADRVGGADGPGAALPQGAGWRHAAGGRAGRGGIDCAGAGPRRLHEDHANARLLAEALSHMEGVEIDLDAVETNIVIFRLKDGGVRRILWRG